jgi:ligand-binding sensor domain-containing protein
MKINLKIMKIVSVLSIVLVAIFIISCKGGDGNGEQPPEIPSIFTNFVFSPVYAFAIDALGGKWFGTVNGVSYLDDNGTPTNKADDTWTTLTAAGSLQEPFWVFAIAIDASGGKWFCTRDSGVSYLDDNGTPTNKEDDTWTTFTTDTFQDIAIDASGGKWFTTHINPYGNGVRYLNDNGTPTNKADDTWTTFTTTDGLANDSVRAVAIDALGGKWFGTYFYGGVSNLDDNGTPTNKADDTWTTFTTADGLAGDSVTAIAIDASGGKWFGIWNGKVSYFNDNGTPTNKTDDIWTTFTESDTLTTYEITSIAIDASGGKWFASNGGGISYLDDNGTPTNKTDDTWVTYRQPDGFPYDYGLIVSIDILGGKWFVASCEEGIGGGLISYLDDNGTPLIKADDLWTIFLTGDGLVYNDVRTVAIDASGGKWFGTGGGGVSYLNDSGTPTNKADDTWVTFTTTDGLAYNYVQEVAIDASGGKWFATNGGGVSYLNDSGTPTNKADDTWVTFTTSDGLASNYVQEVAIDASGAKWFGAGKVSYLDDNGTPTNKTDDTWTTFTTTDGLAGYSVTAIAIDASGGKWFGTYDSGVSSLDDKGTPTNKGDDTWISFTTVDGLASDKINAIVVDSAGGKWFATYGDGVSFLDDKGTPTNKGDDTWITFTELDGLQSNWIDVVAIDASGGKWFGAGYISYLNDNGTPTYKGDDNVTTFDSYDAPNGVQAIVIDSSGGKWFGTNWGGVSYCP